MSSRPGFLLGTSLAGALALAGFGISAAAANDIISEWAPGKPPPAPELKPVALEGKTTALLMLDLMKIGCSARPRCLATVPNVKRLDEAARAAGAMVFYTLTGVPSVMP